MDISFTYAIILITSLLNDPAASSFVNLLTELFKDKLFVAIICNGA